MNEFDLITVEAADAVAATGEASGMSRHSVIGHVGSPTLATLSFEQIDADGLELGQKTVDQTTRAAHWNDAVLSDRWGNHRFEVLLPEVDPDLLLLSHGLRKTTGIGSVLVSDEDLSANPDWSWPLRLGWLRDTSGEEIARIIADPGHDLWNQRHRPSWLDWLVEVDEFGRADGPTGFDFLFLQSAEQVTRLRRTRGLYVNGLIVEGAPGQWSDDLLPAMQDAAEHVSAAAVLSPGLTEVDDLAGWFADLVEQLAHRNPVDVAVGKTTASGIVIGNTWAEMSPLSQVTARMSTAWAETPPPTALPWPDLFDAPDDSGVWSEEGSGASDVAEIRRRLEQDGVDLLGTDNRQRFLQAAVYHTTEDGIEEPVEHAFVAGETHGLHLWLGNGATGFLRGSTPDGVAQPVELAAIGRPDIEADIVLWGDDHPIETRPVWIERTWLSELASFEVQVPASAKVFKRNAALLVDGRVIQSGVISGPVTPRGGAPRRADAPDMEFVVGPNLVDLSVLDDFRSGSAVTLIEEPEGGHVMFERELSDLALGDFAGHFSSCVAALVNAQADSTSATWLRSKKGAAVFRDLATKGGEAFQALVGDLALNDAAQVQAMIDADMVHVSMLGTRISRFMVELFYDREVPDLDAGWCENVDEALETGSCPSCPPWNPDDGPVGAVPVCPAGFWGVRKIIERTITTHDDQGLPVVLKNEPPQLSSTIEQLGDVLVGASDRIGKGKIAGKLSRTVMLERLADALGEKPEIVADWATWQDRVAGFPVPQVLVLLTHTEADALELGGGDKLRRLRIKGQVIRQPSARATPGPIVLLLGCETAVDTSSLISFATQFKDRGAAAVVATIGTTLGRFAAPIAADLVAEFTRPAGPLTLGEAVRNVRRTSLQNGWVTGLLINSFGSTTYRIGV